MIAAFSETQPHSPPLCVMEGFKRSRGGIEQVKKRGLASGILGPVPRVTKRQRKKKKKTKKKGRTTGRRRWSGPRSAKARI